ncbi:hypothetical protein [Lactococcus petauri]|uniref:Uncharacterized protein n=1 Tax=Lactococcus petauri TaxID=1940789 RepID=A0ABZ2SDT8_9LACT|nr:hypothetical protein [Lactococcus petauri]OAL08782.1 hypothetical protein A7X72_01093 [Lactococcus garvieae]MCI3871541.1 hypothetical protein [Lactococcus petauri]MCQ8275934.1 hypothetical protein [Lactococcus petauri]MCR6589473.1 hypothetical protein [Lactococcus petauri]MCU7364112.1 hypothetical protein [Lactococcus petauri]
MKNIVAIAVLIALEIVVIALLKVLGIVDSHSTLAVIIVIIFAFVERFVYVKKFKN